MKFSSATIFSLWVFLTSFNCFAYGTGPSFAAYLIPGALEENKVGDYDKILTVISKMIGKPINYEVLPPARVENGLKTGSLDCVIPLDRRFWDGKESLINSEPLNVAKIFIFSRKNEGPYTSLDQLKGKKLGARRGMPYGPKIDKDYLLDLVTTDDQNVQKLNSKRIDAFLAYYPDMPLWAKEHKSPLPNHAQVPFDTHKDAFLCRDTPDVREFLKSFDEAVVKLRKSGELKKMLGDTYVP